MKLRGPGTAVLTTFWFTISSLVFRYQLNLVSYCSSWLRSCWGWCVGKIEYNFFIIFKRFPDSGNVSADSFTASNFWRTVNFDRGIVDVVFQKLKLPFFIEQSSNFTVLRSITNNMLLSTQRFYPVYIFINLRHGASTVSIRERGQNHVKYGTGLSFFKSYCVRVSFQWKGSVN